MTEHTPEVDALIADLKVAGAAHYKSCQDLYADTPGIDVTDTTPDDDELRSILTRQIGPLSTERDHLREINKELVEAAKGLQEVVAVLSECEGSIRCTHPHLGLSQSEISKLTAIAKRAEALIAKAERGE